MTDCSRATLLFVCVPPGAWPWLHFWLLAEDSQRGGKAHLQYQAGVNDKQQTTYSWQCP